MSQQDQRNVAGSRGAGAASVGPASLAGRRAAARIVAFAVIACAWVVIDQVIKAAVDEHAVGTALSAPIAGVFRLMLVHNTGGAWSMFSGATIALGIFSVVMCVALTALLVVERNRISWPEAIGLALVVGGGVGNAIDRFVLGYVVDYIDLTFFQFPVFNFADIGVTCGIALFLVAFLIRQKQETTHSQGGQR